MMGSGWKKFWMFDDPRSYGARAILRGAAEGLEANGKTVRLFAHDPDSAEGVAAMRKDLAAFRPDAILLANHPASSFFHQIGIHHPPCAALVWVLDDPLIMGDERFGAEERVLVADPGFVESARARGAERIIFLPVAAPDEEQGERRREYQATAAYVGSTLRLSEIREKLGAETADYLDRIIEMKLQSPVATFKNLVEQYPLDETRRVVWSGQLAYYLNTEANRRYRMQYLEPLAAWDVKLYGNETWEEEIRGTALEGCYGGKLDPFHDYPCLIQSVTVNLNLRSLQGFTAPVQRDFLMPRLGGFMLATPSQGTWANWERLDPGGRFRLDRFIWAPEMENPESVAEMMSRYLNEPTVREEWVDHARKEILVSHTYAKRMEQLGDLLEESEK